MTWCRVPGASSCAFRGILALALRVESCGTPSELFLSVNNVPHYVPHYNVQRCSGLSAGYGWVKDQLGTERAEDLRARAGRVLSQLLGLVADPAPYPWSSCAAYALGTSTPLITIPPSSLALRPSPKVRHRQYRTLLVPSADPRADARDPRWTTRRAVGGAAPLGGWPMDPGARKVKVVSFYHGQTARLR